MRSPMTLDPRVAARRAEHRDRMRDESVAVLELGVRVTNALQEAGVHTLDDLLRSSADRISKISNIGAKTLAEIYAKLEEHHFYRPGREPQFESQAEIRRRRMQEQFGIIE